MRITAALLASAAWGFAEATLFFVIPDVLLTRLALRRRRLALLGCAAATLGAVAGGATIYAWAAADPAAARAAVDAVPFVPTSLIVDVGEDLRRYGLAAVFQGPWIGKPYKVYALLAPGTGIAAAAFLFASVPARALRFVTLTLLAGVVGPWLDRRRGRRFTNVVWAALWLLEYAVYWALMSRG
jgi:membrane protein YqaA with SNARE-associated domain